MYRGVRFGDLAEIDILDTRQFRSNQPCEDGFKPVCPEVRAQAATVLGAEQEAWLARNLSRRPGALELPRPADHDDVARPPHPRGRAGRDPQHGQLGGL